MPVTEAGEGHLYNGAVEALTTLTGAALSFALGYARLNWALVGEPALFVTSAVGGAVLVLMAGTEDIWVAYAGYALFRALYQMMITVARLSCMCTIDALLVFTNSCFPQLRGGAEHQRLELRPRLRLQHLCGAPLPDGADPGRGGRRPLAGPPAPPPVRRLRRLLDRHRSPLPRHLRPLRRTARRRRLPPALPDGGALEEQPQVSLQN